MLQRVVVSGADISERKLVEEVVGEHQKEHVRMDSRGYKGTYIRRKYDHSTNLENQIRITLDLSVQIMKYLYLSKKNIQVE